MTSADYIDEGLDGDISDGELDAGFRLAQYEYEHENEEDDDLDDMKLVVEALEESDERIPYEELINKIVAKRSELYSALDEILEDD